MTEKDENYWKSVQTVSAESDFETKPTAEPVVTETTTTETKTDEVAKEEVAAPDVKAETKDPEAQEKQSFFDRFTKLETTETKESETKQPETTAAISPEAEKWKKELDEIKSHPAFQLLTGGKDLAEVDLKAFFKGAIGEDFSALSDDQLIEKSLRSNPAFSQLTEQEATEELEKAKSEFTEMGKLDRLTKRNQMVDTLNKTVPENDILKKLSELQENQRKSVDPEEYYNQKYQETFDTTYKTIETYFEETGKSLVGQKYNGYEVTQEDVNSMMTAFKKNSHEFDKEKVFFEYFLAATSDKREAAAEKRGYEKGLKQAVNPSMNNSSSTTIAPKDGTVAKDANYWKNTERVGQ